MLSNKRKRNESQNLTRVKIDRVSNSRAKKLENFVCLLEFVYLILARGGALYILVLIYYSLNS